MTDRFNSRFNKDYIIVCITMSHIITMYLVSMGPFIKLYDSECHNKKVNVSFKFHQYI